MTDRGPQSLPPLTGQPPKETLVSFRDGSYKRVVPVSWKHSQWLHFKLADGSEIAVNPANVNYLHIGLPEAAAKQ